MYQERSINTCHDTSYLKENSGKTSGLRSRNTFKISYMKVNMGVINEEHSIAGQLAGRPGAQSITGSTPLTHLSHEVLR